MVLPSTGNTISFNDIRIELGISTQSPFGLDQAENGNYVAINKCAVPYPASGNPAEISEWWSYDHSVAATEIALTDSNATSCSAACAQFVNGDVTLYYNQGQTTVFIDDDCNTLAGAAFTTYYADIDRVNCYTVTSGTLTATCTCNGTC